MPTVSEVTAQAASGLVHVDALLDQGPGWNWISPQRNTLLYTFALSGGNASDIGTKLAAAPAPFTTAQQDAATQALARLAQITGINFVKTDDGSAADLHFGAGDLLDTTAAGLTSSVWNYSFSGTTVTAYTADSYIYLDNANFASVNAAPAAGTQGYEILLHELGHAFGLKHPFEGTTRLPTADDNTQKTLMSYTHVGGPYSDFAPYDIAALQFLYGGDGLGGALGYSTSGRYLVGSEKADTLLGGNGNDVFEGKAGNDTIDGKGGTDTVTYGSPRAAYGINAAGGQLTITGPDGTDALLAIETLRFLDQTVLVSALTNQPPVGTVSVTGTVQQGATLSVTSTVTDGDGLGLLSFRWQSSADGNTWANLAGSTSATFTPAQAQVGSRLRVVASYTDGLGNPESVTSTGTAPVANVNDPPVGSVTISGGANVGSVLSPNITLSDLDGIGAYTYRWQSSPNASSWTDIPGATSPGFMPTNTQIGLQLRLVLSYVDGFGTTESVPSSPTATVGGPNSAPTGTLAVSGTAQQGQLLSLQNTLQDADGLGTFTYRWQSTPTGTPVWADISQATGPTLSLSQSQVGTLVRAIVSYTDGRGAGESVTSAATTVVQNVNDPPTGTVGIQGTVTLGGLLTISQNLADLDGLGSLSFQWQSTFDGNTWNDIPNATALRFSPGQAQSGLRLRAVVSYNDNYGTAESVASPPTQPVGTANAAPIGSVTITGQATEGRELQVQNSVFDPDGMGASSYRWQSSPDGSRWDDIVGATGDRFTPSQSQVGLRVRVVLSYIDGKGVLETVAADPTPVIDNVNAVPTGTLTLVGTVRQGQTLTVQNNLGDADGLGTFSYRWQSSANGTSWSDIVGATQAGFTATQAEVGLRLRAQVSYVDGGGTAETVYSAATALVQNVNDAPTGQLSIEGTPTRGLPLTARSTLADADGLGAFTYQWQVSTGFLNWTAIEGATGATFTPGSALVGQLLRLQVTYVDGQGTTETVTTPAAAPVLLGNSPPTGQVSVVGTARQGTALSLNSTLADDDGLGAFSYAWQQSTDGNTWLPINGATAATFTPGEAQAGQRIRVQVSYIDGKSEPETVFSAATPSVLGVLRGTAGPDVLSGTAFADEISGLLGNDRITGLGGNDFIIGGEGIDTAVFAGARSRYQLSPGGSAVQDLSGAEGSDTLLQVERLAFSDFSLAFDLDGQAGLTAKLLGSVFGKAAVANKAYAGIGLAALGAGSSTNDLVQLALNARLGTGFTPTDEVNLLYQNLTGRLPSASDLSFWVGTLTSGQYTAVSLALLAANHELNTDNIDLVGLIANGLAFTP